MLQLIEIQFQKYSTVKPYHVGGRSTLFVVTAWCREFRNPETVQLPMGDRDMTDKDI